MKLKALLCLALFGFYTKLDAFLVVEYAHKIDYTHDNITRGALEQVAAFYIATFLKPGDFNINTQNASEINELYFKTAPESLDGYKKAVDDIVRGFRNAQRQIQTSPKITMSNEQINEGNRYLNTLRQQIIAIVQGKDPDWTIVRERIGMFLFSLQDFYSNTNWIEMGGSVLPTLGWNSTLGVTIADPYQETCKDCKMTSVTQMDCKDNIILSGQTLTSGYIDWNRTPSGVKPYSPNWAKGEGKCSHGGQSDSSRLSSAVGGINKETIKPNLSPHYFLHQKAGKVAINATVNFFIGKEMSLLSTLVREDLGHILGFKEESCLQCFKPSLSLVFVIDTTGSMANEIAEVRTRTTDIVVHALSNSASHPYNFILVTFNDPAILTTVHITQNGTEMIEHLSHLVAHGGWDCPEYSLTGILAAAKAAQRDSCILFFTDADAKDDYLLPKVSRSLQEKSLHLVPILTGQCSGDSVETNETHTCIPSTQRRRAKRAVGNLYGELGFIVPVKNKDITKPLGSILEHNMGITYVSQFEVTMTRQKINILIDSRISAFTVEINGTSLEPKSALKTPNGSIESFTGKNAIYHLSGNIYKMGIIAPSKGIWVLDNTGSYESWLVKIKLQGQIEMKQTFLEDVFGALLPILGSSPIAGSHLTLQITVKDLDEQDTLLSVMFKDRRRNVLYRTNFTTLSKDGDDILGMASVQIPSEPFKVVIEGTEKSNPFHRELAEIIHPTSAQLITNETEGIVFVGKNTYFKCSVKNEGSSSETYHVTARDTANFVMLSSQSVNVASGSLKEISITLQGRSSPLTSVMTVSLLLGGKELQKQDIVLMVQLSIPPEITLSSRSSSCDSSVMNFVNCSNQQINVTVNVNTKNDISEIYTKPSLNIRTKKGGSMQVVASGDCCNPKFTLFVVDNSSLETDHQFDFTDGNAFSTEIPINAEQLSPTKENSKVIIYVLTGVGLGVIATVAVTVIIMNRYGKYRRRMLSIHTQ